MKKGQKPDPQSEIVCLCNEVSRGEIEKAIRAGCRDLNRIYDRTQAGVGPCGGSCRQFIGPFLDAFLEDGKFPCGPVRPKKQKPVR